MLYMKSKDTGGSVRKLRAALLWECFVIVVSRMHGLKNKSSTGKAPQNQIEVKWEWDLLWDDLMDNASSHERWMRRLTGYPWKQFPTDEYVREIDSTAVYGIVSHKVLWEFEGQIVSICKQAKRVLIFISFSLEQICQNILHRKNTDPCLVEMFVLPRINI